MLWGVRGVQQFRLCAEDSHRGWRRGEGSISRAVEACAKDDLFTIDIATHWAGKRVAVEVGGRAYRS